MVNKKILAFAIVLLVAVIYFSTEKADPLISRINDFVEEFESGENESKLAKAMTANSLSKYFNDTVSVNIPRYGEERELSRGDMKSLLLMATTSSGNYSVNVVDPVVVSRTETTGSVEAVLQIDRAQRTDINHVRIDMVKIDGEWLFWGCEEKAMLEK